MQPEWLKPYGEREKRENEIERKRMRARKSQGEGERETEWEREGDRERRGREGRMKSRVSHAGPESIQGFRERLLWAAVKVLVNRDHSLE